MNWRKVLTWSIHRWDDSVQSGDIVRLRPAADFAAIGATLTSQELTDPWVVSTVYMDDSFGDELGTVQVIPLDIYDLGTIEEENEHMVHIPLLQWPEYLELTGRKV